MRYLVLPTRAEPGRVALRLVVGVGRLHENKNQHGLAHLIEHLAFAGSENFPPGTVKPYFESLGIKFGRDGNASTGAAHTTYLLTLPVSDRATVQKALVCFGDFARRLIFTPAVIEHERQVVLNERRDRAAEAAADRAYTSLDFPGTVAADRVNAANDEAVVRTATREQLQAAYRAWYRPESTTLVIAGDVDPAGSSPMIAEQFGEWKSSGPAPELPSVVLTGAGWRGPRWRRT